jgi:hypothetical protein
VPGQRWWQVRVRTLLAEVPARAWHRLSCGDGAKGPRLYDWALVRTNSPEPDKYIRWLLIRRSALDPSEVAYFACGGPPGTGLEELVRVAVAPSNPTSRGQESAGASDAGSARSVPPG